MLCGIKRFVEEAGSTRHQVTDQTLLLIFKALDLSKKDHTMFWTACNLQIFWFSLLFSVHCSESGQFLA